MANATPRPYYITVDGILFPPFPQDCIREALTYKPKPEDVFIATYPKCGTTWMQNIVLYIFRKGKELQDHTRWKTYCPFIERGGSKSMEDMPRPGAFKTHVPFTHVPYCPDAKYIYVLRNPKDCCVSMYYHTTNSRTGEYADATFDDFFEIFMAGEVEYNDYFDHWKSWYPHTKDKNVLFATYEDMKKDAREVVLKVANFLGPEYIGAIERDNGVLNNILRFSGFDFMKEHLSEVFRESKKDGLPTNNSDTVEKGEEKPACEEELNCADQKPKKEKPEHLRKGIVGDWKRHFSEEQSERMNKKFIERMQGTDIYEVYKPYMGL